MKQAHQQLVTMGEAARATLEAGESTLGCVVKVGGDWRLNAPVPSWMGLMGDRVAVDVRVVPEGLGSWDTSLLLFLVHGRTWCLGSKRVWSAEALPRTLQSLLGQVAESGTSASKVEEPAKPLMERVESMVARLRAGALESISFVGDCALGVARMVANPRKFRWMDCLIEMQRCWASSLPIVSLVSFLVGVILAFQAAIQLQQYGAAVFVADLVGLSVVREMGPMMAAVIMAGGIGAAFAAQLGNMRVDEEMDALETLGISTVDFVALPRLMAVTVMMPIVALYANVLGVLGGMFVGATMLGIPSVLKDVTFTVRAREVLFVIGGSGCGKSTLLRCLIGLLKPLKGDIAYFGKSFIAADADQRREILKTFGVIYQNNALWSSMTLAENVALPLEEHTRLSRADREEIVALKLNEVGLSGSGGLYPWELSGGMKKRAALARALALDPAIAFFDEPSAGLDPITSRDMDRLILRVRDTLGTTLVIVSHQLSSIFRLADRVLVLDQKSQGIIAEGEPGELASRSEDPRVREFLNETGGLAEGGAVVPKIEGEAHKP